MNDLLLIRHAETDMAGTFCGQANPPVNAAGHHQIQTLIERLRVEPLHGFRQPLSGLRCQIGCRYPGLIRLGRLHLPGLLGDVGFQSLASWLARGDVGIALEWLGGLRPGRRVGIGRRLGAAGRELVRRVTEQLLHAGSGLRHGAAQCFGRSADIDRPASLFAARARELAQNPPGEDWDPIRTLQEK